MNSTAEAEKAPQGLIERLTAIPVMEAVVAAVSGREMQRRGEARG